MKLFCTFPVGVVNQLKLCLAAIQHYTLYNKSSTGYGTARVTGSRPQGRVIYALLSATACTQNGKQCVEIERFSETNL